MLIFSTLTEKSRSLWCRKPFMHFTFLLLTGSLESLSEYPLKPTSLFVTEGELEALPGMWLSCCFLGNVVLCEWQMQGNVEGATLESCHWVSAGYRILNNNAVFCIFVPILPLSILLLYFLSSSFLSIISLLQTRDLKKVGVTIVGPQKKIVSSLKAVESHTKNGPVPV